jgi:hypothetical protein
MTTIDEAVPAGAEFLDIHDPDWWRPDVPNAIDLDTLRLADSRVCVLGQRCPLETLAGYSVATGHDMRPVDRYWALASAFSGLDGWSLDAWARQHGFSIAAEPDDGAWDDLTLAWWVLINERRKLAADAAAQS